MKRGNKLVLGCSGGKHIARRIARKAGADYGEVFVERLPDTELRIRLGKNVRGKRVYFVQSFYDSNKNDVNDKLIELMFAARTAKELKARKIFLIAPYMAYLREDKRFEKGEVVSAKILADMFRMFERVYIVEPHLHRFKRFDEFFPNAQRVRLFHEVLNYIKKNVKGGVVLVGPDSESEQWVVPVAEELRVNYFILKKKRFNPKKVKVKGEKIVAKNVVIIDDIISTGNTLLKAAKLVKAKKIYFIGMHGVFSDSALSRLKKKGVVVVSNSIPSSTSKLDCTDVLAKRMK